MVEMMQRSDGLAAEYAIACFVPAGDDVPHQAILRIGLDLLQALLTAILALGPAGTFLEPDRRFIDERAQGSLFCGHSHCDRSPRLRTGYQALTAKPEIRLHSWNRAKHKQRTPEHQNSDDDGEHR